MELGLINVVRKKIEELVPVAPISISLDQPLMSVTFDDFPRSAWLETKDLLHDCEVKATFYVSGSFVGRTIDSIDFYKEEDLAEVDENGHEIGCHTYYHESCVLHSLGRLGESVEKNIEYVRDVIGRYEPTAFAYPYGHSLLASRHMLSRRFLTCRGVSRQWDTRVYDRSLVPSIGLEKRRRHLNDWNTILESVAHHRGWLTIFTHDVSAHPSEYGCTQSELHRLIQLARSYGYGFATMTEAYRLLAGNRSM
ncbi:polysaccharide deacetylase family protein [Microvirga sp. M2]|uniref:polysaccharide deacetylase family protein n=1 Tax=Microvirga sp. M2 TaxID=3073270 RepID=UPI0039C4AC4D